MIKRFDLKLNSFGERLENNIAIGDFQSTITDLLKKSTYIGELTPNNLIYLGRKN